MGRVDVGSVGARLRAPKKTDVMAHCRQFGTGCGVLQQAGSCVCVCSMCAPKIAALSDERLSELLATVSVVGSQCIPPNTPCFWDRKDRVSCTYDDLRAVIGELQKRRAADKH
jgi:hypothetical protein